jgi:uroporphyrinogen decarboxylase
MLSKPELLLATIAHKKTDRTPIAFWRHWPIEDGDAEALANASVGFAKRYDLDLIKVTPSQSFVCDDYGRTKRYDGNPEGDVQKGEPPVQTIEQWEALKPLDVQKGALGRQLRCLKLIGATAGEIPFIQTIFNPLTVAKCLAEERAVVWRRKFPDAFARGYRSIIETWTNFVAAVQTTGAAGVFFAVADASYGIMSYEEYERWGRAADLEVLSANKPSWFSMLHIHGDDIMFDRLSDYPVQAVNWHDRKTWPNLAEAQKLFSGVVVGGISQWDVLLAQGPEAVRAQVQDGIRQTGGLGYMVGTGCVMPIPVSDSNIRAAISAARFE